MPAPAHRCARSPATRPERIATASSPLPSRSNQPTGRRVPAARRDSRAAIHSVAMRVGVPPTAGVGCRRLRELEHVTRLAQLGRDRRVEMQHVAQRAHAGLVRHARRRAPSPRAHDAIASTTIACSRRSLRAREQRGRGVRIGADDLGAARRDPASASHDTVEPVEADQALGRRRDERAAARAGGRATRTHSAWRASSCASMSADAGPRRRASRPRCAPRRSLRARRARSHR